MSAALLGALPYPVAITVLCWMVTPPEFTVTSRAGDGAADYVGNKYPSVVTIVVDG